MPLVKYDESGKVHRLFTEEWANNSVINISKIPDIVTNLLTKIDKNELSYSLVNMDMLPHLIKSLIDQRKAMIFYMQELHSEIDKLNASLGLVEDTNKQQYNKIKDLEKEIKSFNIKQQ